MKKKLIITEDQYKRLNLELTENSSFSNIKTAAVYRGSEVFEKLINAYDDNFSVDELTEIAKFLISGVKSSLESYYTDMASNAGAAPDEYEDDDMTYDQFGGETHGY